MFTKIEFSVPCTSVETVRLQLFTRFVYRAFTHNTKALTGHFWISVLISFQGHQIVPVSFPGHQGCISLIPRPLDSTGLIPKLPDCTGLIPKPPGCTRIIPKSQALQHLTLEQLKQANYCSATEPQQPDNHQPSQSSICTAQVVLNASVAHLKPEVSWVWLSAAADLFHFPLFLPHNIHISSLRQDALSKLLLPRYLWCVWGKLEMFNMHAIWAVSNENEPENYINVCTHGAHFSLL